MTESLGERLRMKRVVAGLSRLALARLAGLSEATIKFIEKGRTKTPSEDSLLRLLRTKELRLCMTDLPASDFLRLRKYFLTEVRDSVMPYIHPLFWRQVQRMRRRRQDRRRQRMRIQRQRYSRLQSPQGDRPETKDRQHCEAGKTYGQKSCKTPQSYRVSDADEALCAAPGGKGVPAASCLGAIPR